MCSVALAVALTPLAALAVDLSPQHTQDELANGVAQFDLAQQQVQDLQTQANLSAANERMIAVLRSQAMRERQLNLVANANAMEAVAAALANQARAQGDFNAANELGIAQIRATALVTKADASLANALAIGRQDEIANAQAQWNIAHQLADTITSVMVEVNMSNAKLIAQERADAIHTPAIVQQQNGLAMGANALFAADTLFQAGALNATSAQLSVETKASAVLAHAAASLANAKAQAAMAH